MHEEKSLPLRAMELLVENALILIDDEFECLYCNAHHDAQSVFEQKTDHDVQSTFKHKTECIVLECKAFLDL